MKKLLILTQLVLIVCHIVRLYVDEKLVTPVTHASKIETRTQKVPLQSSPSIDNPNFIRDRLRNIINKPEMPLTWTNRYRQVYDSNWMDYCDPYHCNDYHRIACGLNRRKMKFKWFQSVCHLIVNNQCSDFRGNLKYDIIANKYCTAYVMFLRSGCPLYTDCDEHKLHPICAMSSKDGHVVLFQNKCFMDAVNCLNSTLQEYDKVKMSICEKALYYVHEPEIREVVEPLSNEKFVVNLGEGI